MAQHRGKFVVSTDEQGKSGLGLEGDSFLGAVAIVLWRHVQRPFDPTPSGLGHHSQKNVAGRTRRRAQRHRSPLPLGGGKLGPDVFASPRAGVVVGCGLMALMLYSSRRGYDERVSDRAFHLTRPFSARQSAALLLDTHPGVKKWVKNDRLGFFIRIAAVDCRRDTYRISSSSPTRAKTSLSRSRARCLTAPTSRLRPRMKPFPI